MVVITQKNIEKHKIYDLYVESKRQIFDNFKQFNIELPKAYDDVDNEIKGVLQEKLPVLEIMFSYF